MNTRLQAIECLFEMCYLDGSNREQKDKNSCSYKAYNLEVKERQNTSKYIFYDAGN